MVKSVTDKYRIQNHSRCSWIRGKRPLVHGIRCGFNMGIKSIISESYTPPNHSSARLNPVIIENHIKNELSEGRYTGPFSKSRLEYLIGPFRSSPLGLIPKSGSPGDFRIIQDLSFPRGGTIPSIKTLSTLMSSLVNGEPFPKL